MIKFFKKQFIKLLLYVVIIGVITLSFSHYNLDKNTYFLNNFYFYSFYG